MEKCEEIGKVHDEDTMCDVKHVKAYRTPKGKANMTHFETFSWEEMKQWIVWNQAETPRNV